MQPLPGFRDFLPADCAFRNYIFESWRETARRYGFVEWDGPVLEPTELYRKKSGPEMAGEIKQAAQEAPEAVEQLAGIEDMSIGDMSAQTGSGTRAPLRLWWLRKTAAGSSSSPT
jgi:ATP phosphoribosyltransferase regulatory subunit HisZ